MMVSLFEDLDRDEAHILSLVLNSVGIGHRVVGRDNRFSIEVPEPLADSALDAVRRYRAENPPTETPPQTSPAHPFTVNVSGIGIALMLLAIYLAVMASAAPEDYVTVFGANARRIVQGERYRCVTALLLHADAAHLVGNMAGMALFGGAVCAAAGTGVGWLMILACGAAGNMINAWAHASGHLSIGASTAVFGAVGILCALQAVDAIKTGQGWKGLLTAIGAGVAFLAFLGAGARSDLGAHLFGLCCGLVLGMAFKLRFRRPPGRVAQLLCGAAAAAVLVSAWIQGY